MSADLQHYVDVFGNERFLVGPSGAKMMTSAPVGRDERAELQQRLRAAATVVPGEWNAPLWLRRLLRDADDYIDQQAARASAAGPAPSFAEQTGHVALARAVRAKQWTSLSDDDRKRIFESMPNGLEGFLKTWGWLPFAKAIEDACREKNAAAPVVATHAGQEPVLCDCGTEDDFHALSCPMAVPAPQPPEPTNVMTTEQYAAFKIVGWHYVCKDWDGFGNVAVHYTPASLRRWQSNGAIRSCASASMKSPL